MGFGTLFFGYFVMFAFALAQAYFFADIIGALIAIYAFSKLSEYNRYFVSAMVSCLAFMVLCGVSAASLMFDIYDPAGNVDMIVDIAKAAAACIMHIFMFLGTRGIAQGAGSVDLYNKANRNLVLTMIYYAASLLVIAFGGILGDSVQNVSMIVFLYWAVCFVLNLVLIYRCFGILCPAEEDEDAPPKRSKFAIVNKLNDKFEEIEANKTAYRKESMQMALDEAEKRAAKNSGKSKHSHKKKKKR